MSTLEPSLSMYAIYYIELYYWHATIEIDRQKEDNMLSWFSRRKNSNSPINAMREITASRYRWEGLEPISLLHQTNGTTIITARLIEKPVDYLNKIIPFQGKLYKINEVQWGKNNKFVGLIVSTEIEK